VPLTATICSRHCHGITSCCSFATKKSQSATKRHIGELPKFFGGILSRCGGSAFGLSLVFCLTAKNAGTNSTKQQKESQGNNV
jgi:hypothetical protein